MRDAKGRFLPDPLRECLLDAVVIEAFSRTYKIKSWREMAWSMCELNFVPVKFARTVKRLWAGA